MRVAGKSPNFPSRRNAAPRREFLRRLGVLGLVPALLPIAPRRVLSGQQPIYYTWEGYDDPAFFPSYASEHGADPITQTFIDENEALDQIRRGLQVDVAHPCNGQVHRWRDEGILQPIDTARLSNWPDLFAELRSIPGAVIGGQQWFVPIDWGMVSVVYRTDLVDIDEESLTLLWDERYAGRLAMGQDASDTVIIAAIVAGARDPYAMTSDELAKTKELLLRQKPLLSFYWSDWDSVVTAIATGEIVASTAWPEVVLALRDKGVPIKFMNPKEGAVGFCCGLVLTKTAPEIDAAYDLIDAILAPEAGKWLIENWGYGHSNRKSFDMIDIDSWVSLGMPRDIQRMLALGRFTPELERLDVMQEILDEVMGVS